MTSRVCVNTPSLNDAKKVEVESDVFSRQQAALDAVKALAVDAFGEPLKPRLPCDDMATFSIEDCKTCAEREVCGGER